MLRSLLPRAVLLTLGILLCYSHAELPPDLPGEEITEEYLKWTIPVDSVKRPEIDSTDRTSAWYDIVAKTWDTPPLAEQMASDRINIPLGKGGIFVPRYTEAKNEPDVEILDLDIHTVTSGETGRTFTVEPGSYLVMLGSGSHKQRIVKPITVEESKISPVMPDWAGLTIETVDTNLTTFRGEYELVRLDDFEPFGRGFGADISLGESVKTWILKPGTYKILGRGESYNTLKNFVTVRLLPGELVKFLLIQRPDNMAIISGGTVDITPGTKITSHWKYGGNIGGMLQFNGEIDRNEAHQEAISTIFSLSTSVWLLYNNQPHEWETMVRIDEGLSLSELDLTSGVDDFRINSLYIWRFLSWFGPFGRAEVRTNLLPRRIRLEDYKKSEFCILENDSTITEESFDTSKQVFQITPSFSPLTLDISGGANFDAVNTNYFELKVRLGVGSSFSSFPQRYQSIDPDEYSDSPYYLRMQNSIVLQSQNKTSIFEFGPQGSISGNINIGRLGTAGAELKVFAPVAPEMRITKPDFDLSATISWRIARPVTLDYDYDYILKQPEDVDARVKKSTHRVWLRFAYSSR